MTEEYKSDYLISEEPFYKSNIRKWVSYDLGNTIFSMVVVSLTITPLLYILYFNQGMTGEEAIKAGNYAIAAEVSTVGIFFSTMPFSYIPHSGHHWGIFEMDGSIPTVESVYQQISDLLKHVK